jgi:hypothetical protein
MRMYSGPALYLHFTDRVFLHFSQGYTETTDYHTDPHTEAYQMCSGSQQGRTGVDGDGGGGSI